MNPFIHELGCCESSTVGSGTRIWAYTHILPGARIGNDCNICDHVFVENDVVIGDRVTVKCGVQLWDGLHIEDDVFIGPNATFSNDPFPRSRKPPEQFATTHIEKGASIGSNATILPGLRIARQAMVGAGAVVTRSVPPFAIVVGNPARIIGYVDGKERASTELGGLALDDTGVSMTNVRGVTLHNLSSVRDLRGNLTAGEFEKDIPFPVKRYFLVYDVPSMETRGEHAHHTCHQFLVCVKGSCSVVTDDGARRQEFKLDRPNLGLHLPSMTWGIQYKYTNDAVLLVFASEHYDSNDYIRDYEEFLSLLRNKARQ